MQDHNGKRLQRLLKLKLNQVAQLFSLQAIEDEEEIQLLRDQLWVIVSSPVQSSMGGNCKS